MNRLNVLFALFTFFFSVSVRAQIFINTGNPDLKKYVQQDSNAVIWDGGKNVPVPPNVAAESKKEQSQPAVAKHNDTINHTAKVVKQPVKTSKETVTVKKEERPKSMTPPVKPKNQEQMPYSAYKKEPVPDYPPDAVVGHCYARCQAPDQYEYKEELVLDKPASVKVDRIQAVYETVNETVVIVPAGKKIITIPAQFETVTENKMVAPASQKWVKVSSSKNCFSPNPKDCEVWSLKDFPAVYEKVSHKVEVVPASVREEEIPAVTQVVPRKKLVKPAEEVKTEIPASYKTISKRVLLKKGGGYQWREILCEQDVTESKINQIQQALLREGYDPGTVDNQMSGKTKESIIKFQQDKGLPVGNLNMETLKALGVQ